MRRSTAAAVGTLTGAALILGVRLSVTPPPAPAAVPPVVDLANTTTSPKPAKVRVSTAPASKKATRSAAPRPAPPKSGLRDGVFKGRPAANPYGTVQVQVRIEGGKITAAAATYPTTGQSARINPPAIATLKQETLKAQSADVAAVSGATYTSRSYRESLQAALDAAAA